MQCYQRASESLFEAGTENRTKFLSIHMPILYSDSSKHFTTFFVTAFALDKYCCQHYNKMRAKNTAEH